MLLPSICLEPFSAGEFDHYEVWNMAPFPFSLILCTVTFQLYNAIKPWKSPKEQQKMNGSYCTLDFIPREQGLCPICNLNHVVMLFTLNDVSWLGCRKKSDMFFTYKLTQCLPTTNSTFKKKKKNQLYWSLAFVFVFCLWPQTSCKWPQNAASGYAPYTSLSCGIKSIKK